MRSVLVRSVLVFVAIVLAWGQLGVARAETCPDVPDDEVALRRSMAKEWFAKAEEAEAAGDRQGAVRRYACSLGLAPHPSTAYNLGTVAEKSGDLSMALDGFRSYLKLAPEATDRPAIEARIVALEAKVSDLRQQLAAKPAPAAAATATPTPVASAPGVPAAAPPPASVATAPTPAPVGATAGTVDGAGTHSRRVGGWVTAAATVVTLGTGIAFNVVARSKMSDCYRLFDNGTPHALDRCDEAKPFAYGSYALFGAAAALGIASAALFLWSPGTTTEEPTTDVALVPTTGGAAFVASRRFW
jgi:tetratricopeptide (TPR) repeat protein